jgi:hypothetical protein
MSQVPRKDATWEPVLPLVPLVPVPDEVPVPVVPLPDALAVAMALEAEAEAPAAVVAAALDLAPLDVDAVMAAELRPPLLLWAAEPRELEAVWVPALTPVWDPELAEVAEVLVLELLRVERAPVDFPVPALPVLEVDGPEVTLVEVLVEVLVADAELVERELVPRVDALTIPLVLELMPGAEDPTDALPVDPIEDDPVEEVRLPREVAVTVPEDPPVFPPQAKPVQTMVPSRMADRVVIQPPLSRGPQRGPLSLRTRLASHPSHRFRRMMCVAWPAEEGDATGSSLRVGHRL